jgi:glycosyltransferase involved in cell wall biosynthesis
VVNDDQQDTHMTVLHVMPSVSRAFGGPTESLIGYAQAARSQGIDIHIAAPSIPDADREWFEEALPGATLHLFDSLGRHAWVIAPGLWVWLFRHGARFDAIHVHGLFNPVSTVAARISTARGWPTVMRPFGTLSQYTFSRHAWLKQMYFRFFDRPALRQAAALHFTTHAERDEAGRHAIASSARAHVVPPPWRGAIPSSEGSDKASHPTALYLSRLHPKKNVLRLIRAWEHVVNELPAAQLWIAGDGEEPYVRRLREEVSTHGLSDHISFLGFVRGTEKNRVLREAWMFVLPSHQENFGVAVLEALAAGLPVVISGEVQLRSFVEEHDLGIVVDRLDEAAIAEGVAALLTDASRRQHIAKAAPDAVQEVFSVDAVGNDLRAMYEQAILAEHPDVRN